MIGQPILARRSASAARSQQLFRAKERIEALISSLPTLVDDYLTTGFTTGSMTATGNVDVGGNVDASGTVTAAAGMTSPGVAATDITAIPGSRTPVWVHEASGIIGQTSSTIRKKTNLEPVPFTAEQFLSVQPYMFQYTAQLAVRDDPENPYYDPDYVPRTEVGLIAEHLDEAGLSAFVIYDGEGQPANVDYAAFGAVAALVIGRELAGNSGSHSGA